MLPYIYSTYVVLSRSLLFPWRPCKYFSYVHIIEISLLYQNAIFISGMHTGFGGAILQWFEICP